MVDFRHPRHVNKLAIRTLTASFASSPARVARHLAKARSIPKHLTRAAIASGPAQRTETTRKPDSARTSPRTSTEQWPPGPGFLSIPTELRLQIYDELFRPMLKRPEHFDSYVMPSEWSKTNLSAYISLTLTSREVRNEANDHFKSQYVPRLILYFDNVPDLFDLTQQLRKVDDEFANVQFCLYTIPPALRRLRFKRSKTGQAGDMAAVDALHAEVLQFSWQHVESTHSAVTSIAAREGKTIRIRRFSRPSTHKQGPFVVSRHVAGGQLINEYSTIRGRVRDVIWGGYGDDSNKLLKARKRVAKVHQSLREPSRTNSLHPDERLWLTTLP